MLFGPAPYGAHLFSILCYVAACVVLYRLVRPAYGRLPAILGLATLLFMPSLFAWSISVLKEPLYFLTMSVGVAAAVTAGRPGPVLKRVVALAILVATAYAAQSIREGGLAMAAVGATSGLAVGMAWRRPRLFVAAALVCIVAVPLIASRGKTMDRVVTGVHQVASVHWGHVNTPGYVYTILDGSFYTRRSAINEMTLRQGVQYVVGSLVTYVVVPLPWKIESRAALTYLPEQIVWYVIVLLAPIGLASGFRRDALLTALFVAYGAIAAMLVAVTSGNIGTLVRHRGLALPYLVWLSVLGFRDTLAWLSSENLETHADHR
jgi:4-amino-4-deoxy-L-arabinose transferase-like glycosyltransferase